MGVNLKFTVYLITATRHPVVKILGTDKGASKVRQNPTDNSSAITTS